LDIGNLNSNLKIIRFLAGKKKEVFLFLTTAFFTLVISIFFVEKLHWAKNKSNWVCEICQFDSALGWALTPSKTISNSKATYTSNSSGFRSREVDPSKDHILVIGDSVAFGVGVSDDETLPHYLEHEFNHYQVLNLAVPGYSLDQYYLTLKKHISKTNVKLVIAIIFTGNDWQETGQDNMFGISKPFFKINNNQLVLTNEKISRYTCNNIFSRSWTIKTLSLKNLRRYVCKPKKLDEKSARKVIIALLDKINALTHQNNARLLFVITPTLYDLILQACNKEKASFAFCLRNKNKDLPFLMKPIAEKSGSEGAAQEFIKRFSGFGVLLSRFQQVFEKSRFNHIDFFHEIAQEDLDASSLYNREPYHFSPKGNKFLAKTIYSHLVKNQTIPVYGKD